METKELVTWLSILASIVVLLPELKKLKVNDSEVNLI